MLTCVVFIKENSLKFLVIQNMVNSCLIREMSVAWKNVNIYATKSCLLLLLLSRFSCVRLCATHRQKPTRFPCPWDSPGKNTGVGCHFLLQCMTVKSESEVTQSCPTLCDPMDCSLSGSSIHGIFQARVLEWGAIPMQMRKGIRDLSSVKQEKSIIIFR